MSATRRELDERIRLTEAARQLNLDAHPPRDPFVDSQSSSAALEQKQHEMKANDEVIVDMADAEDELDTLSATASVVIKKILLPIPDHDETTDADCLPDDIQAICLAYGEESQEELVKESNKKLEYQYHHTSFFSKHLALQLRQAADAVLKGDQASVDYVIKLVNEKRVPLTLSTKGQNAREQWVEGTLLQIAAMAGDVNLRKKTAKEKDHGLVELLAEAGKLSQEEVANQIHAVLFTEEAQQKNKERKQLVIDALVAFANNIIAANLPASWNTIEEFKAAQAKSQPYIDTFRKALLPDPNEVITSGYIFDPDILVKTAEWFENKENIERLGGWWSLKSDLFWVNGFGSLQGATSARDAQVIREGIGNVVDDKNLPPRTLKNSDGSSYFFDAASRLGWDFFVGYFAGRPRLVSAGRGAGGAWKTYVEQKQQHCKTYAISGQSVEKPLPNILARR
jgi:hypothetical protein